MTIRKPGCGRLEYVTAHATYKQPEKLPLSIHDKKSPLLEDIVKQEPLRARCPRCLSEQSLASWDDLTEEERMVVRRLPQSAHLNLQERTRHRWCRRCWYEDEGRSPSFA